MQITVRSTPQPLDFQEALRLEGLLRLHLSAIAQWAQSAEAVVDESIGDSRATRYHCHLAVHFGDQDPLRSAGTAATPAGALGMAAGAALRVTLNRARNQEDDTPPLAA